MCAAKCIIGIDIVIGEQRFEQIGIAGITDDEFARGNRLAKSRAQIVERDMTSSPLAPSWRTTWLPI